MGSGGTSACGREPNGGGRMRRIVIAAGSAALSLAGCASHPLADNPAIVRANCNAEYGNPILVTPADSGPEAYAAVFEHTLDVLDDYFEIAYANRYDGRIETVPRVAPGVEQFWKPGSPDLGERVLMTLQSYRHRCFVLIEPAPAGGYLVTVNALRELEDLPRPTRTSDTAVFRNEPSVERQFEVIDPTVLTTGWIPKGRDVPLEQELIRRIRCVK